MPPLLTEGEARQAKRQAKSPQVTAQQRLNVRYHVESPLMNGRVERFLEVFGAILRHSNYGVVLDHYLRTSAKCARCAMSCMLYEATGDPKDVPCYRTALLLNVYRRHFTLAGVLQARLLGRRGLSEEDIEEMADSFWNCTACRKCVLECPAGIDHGLITHLGRYILSEIRIVPRALSVSVREQLEGKTRNTSAILLAAMQDTLEFLQEEIEEDKGLKVRFPLDEVGAEYLFMAPVSDYLVEADTLSGIAVVLNLTGASWTIGSQNYDAINYGLFYNDRMMDRILKQIAREVDRLQVKKILVGECGHALRTAKAYARTFCGGENAPEVVSIIEYTYEALRAGRIRLDPSVIAKRVTYHDPCNIARKGWIVDQPREVLRSFCENYVDMEPKGRENYCCGGGGAMIWASPSAYFPAWTEFAISAGVVSGAVLVFLYAVERFNVWQDRPEDEETTPHRIPRFDPISHVWLGDPVAAGFKRNSLGFVLAAAVGFSFLSFGSLETQGLQQTPAEPSRGYEVLRIDANRDTYYVTFDHKRHTESLAGDRSCEICHHAHLPRDKYTPCSSCHSDVYLKASIFNHRKHQERLGENHSCDECHPPGENKTALGIDTCEQCHIDELALSEEGTPIRMTAFVACSHTDAMHGLCVSCHREIAERIDRPCHGLCGTCHPAVLKEEDLTEWEKRTRSITSHRWVISVPLLPENVDTEQLRRSVSQAK